MTRARLETIFSLFELVDFIGDIALDPLSRALCSLLHVDLVLTRAYLIILLSCEDLLCVFLSDQLSSHVLFVAKHVVMRWN